MIILFNTITFFTFYNSIKFNSIYSSIFGCLFCFLMYICYLINI